MIHASKLGLEQNHALLANLPQLQPNPNHQKSPIYFMKGDPTEFGLEYCRMPEQGLDIVRNQINNPNNHSYTASNGSPQGRDAIAKQFDHGKNLTANDVVITAGVNIGLYYVFLASCEYGHNILVPDIGYPFYDQIAPSFGVEVRKYKLNPDKDWEIDIEELNRLLDQNTKFLFVINPSNPCGSVFSREHVNDIVTWAEKHCILIVADEVYYGLSFTQYTSFGELAKEGPIICLSGLEKIFFVPGWQTSWLIYYDKNNYLHEIKEGIANMCQLFLHSNTFVMNSLPELFAKVGIEYVQKSLPSLKQNHDYLYDKLNHIKGLKAIKAQGTFYMAILIDLTVLDFKDDVDFITRCLEEENFSAFPLSCTGTKSYQGFRLLTCSQHDLLEDLVQRLKGFCERHQRQT